MNLPAAINAPGIKRIRLRLSVPSRCSINARQIIQTGHVYQQDCTSIRPKQIGCWKRAAKSVAQCVDQPVNTARNFTLNIDRSFFADGRQGRTSCTVSKPPCRTTRSLSGRKRATLAELAIAGFRSSVVTILKLASASKGKDGAADRSAVIAVRIALARPSSLCACAAPGNSRQVTDTSPILATSTGS